MDHKLRGIGGEQERKKDKIRTDISHAMKGGLFVAKAVLARGEFAKVATCAWTDVVLEREGGQGARREEERKGTLT